jgi:hypothetical protein
MFERERTNKMKTSRMTDLSPDGPEPATKNKQPVHGEGSPVEHHEVCRRTLLKGSGALAGLWCYAWRLDA